MARTTQFKIEASRPLHAVVGAGDLAVKRARTAAADVQARFARIELEPKALREQARTRVAARVEELNKDAKALPDKVEAYVNQAGAELTETMAEMNKRYDELALRGRTLVDRIRRQESTQETKAAAANTVARAKTGRTQTARTAKAAAGATGAAAKSTAATAKRTTKATTNAARKTGAAATEATTEAAKKVGD